MRIGLKMSHENAILMGKAKLTARSISGVGAARIDGATILSTDAKNNTVLLIDFADQYPSANTAKFKAVYKNNTEVMNIQDNGVSYTDAHANGWLLTNSVGGELTWQGSTKYLPDLANTGYQAAWALNVYNTLTSLGINAVFNDGLIYDYHDATSQDAYRSGTLITLTEWHNNTIAFWRYVGEYLRSRGIRIAGNATVASDDHATSTKAWWAQLVFASAGPFMPGKACIDWFMVEFYMRVSFAGDPGVRLDSAANWYWNWDDWRTLPDTCHAIGAGLIGFDWGSDTSGRDISELAADPEACRYEYASLLLNFDPQYYDCHMFSTHTDDQWAIGSHSVNIGNPTAAAVKQGNGTWTRTFSNGQVLVNPTTSSQTTSGHTLASGTAYIGT